MLDKVRSEERISGWEESRSKFIDFYIMLQTMEYKYRDIEKRYI